MHIFYRSIWLKIAQIEEASFESPKLDPRKLLPARMYWRNLQSTWIARCRITRLLTNHEDYENRRPNTNRARTHAKTGQIIQTLAIDSKDKVNTLRQYVIRRKVWPTITATYCCPETRMRALVHEHVRECEHPKVRYRCPTREPTGKKPQESSVLRSSPNTQTKRAAGFALWCR